MTINGNRSQLIWSPVLGWVLLSCLASGAQAQEETSTPALQTIEQVGVDADALPVELPTGSGGGITREETGITLGAYTLNPSLEILAGYNDNVFTTNQYITGQPPIASPFTLIKPALELRSEWLNHSIRAIASGGFGFYSNAPTQNYQNFVLGLEGKLEIFNDFYVAGKIGFVQATEALGTPNVAFAQAPTVDISVPVELSVYQKFNRFFYQVTGAATQYTFYDNSLITSQGLPGYSRNYTGYDENIRLGYELFDDTAFFISPGLNQRIYQQVVNAAGQQRDSRGWYFTGGATSKLGPKTQLEGFVGYQTLSYIFDGTTTGSSIFGLKGSWNGYPPLVLRPMILRSINESALSNYQNFISTIIGVDFTYDVHGPWQAVGGTSFNTADYTPAFGVPNVNPRTDYFFKGSLGFMYSLRPQLQIGPLYEYTQAWTTDIAAGGPQYSSNQISIRLITRR